jgi:hypothetical protein
MIKFSDTSRLDNNSVQKVNFSLKKDKIRLLADSRVVSEFASRSKINDFKPDEN